MCFGGEYLHTVTASTTEQVHGSLWLWTGTRNGHQLCSYSPQFANVVLTSLLPLHVLLLQNKATLMLTSASASVVQCFVVGILMEGKSKSNLYNANVTQSSCSALS